MNFNEFFKAFLGFHVCANVDEARQRDISSVKGLDMLDMKGVLLWERWTRPCWPSMEERWTLEERWTRPFSNCEVSFCQLVLIFPMVDNLQVFPLLKMKSDSFSL